MALSLPKRLAKKTLDKILGTWSFQAIMETSFAQVSKKWKHLYGKDEKYNDIKKKIEDTEYEIQQKRNLIDLE